VNSDRSRVREAFDRHAVVYDQLFSRSSIGQEIRAEVWEIAGDVFSRGMKVWILDAEPVKTLFISHGWGWELRL
jgi:hypothetical protein